MGIGKVGNVMLYIPNVLMVPFLFSCRELIYELHKREKEVFLISGGFRSIIEPIAKTLNIPTANIYANRLKFFYDGEWSYTPLLLLHVGFVGQNNGEIGAMVLVDRGLMIVV